MTYGGFVTFFLCFVIKPLRVCRALYLCITFLSAACAPLENTIVSLIYIVGREEIVAPTGRHRALQGMLS